jgi:hypothetical protein
VSADPHRCGRSAHREEANTLWRVGLAGSFRYRIKADLEFASVYGL